MAALLVFPSPLPPLRALLRRCWGRLERGLLPRWDLPRWDLPRWDLPRWDLPRWDLPRGPALAVQAPVALPEAAEGAGEGGEEPGAWEGVLWMAAPKKRRTIEVNRCRRRDPRKLIKVKRNIDVCPECGHLKLKHVLCGYCYAKVKAETRQIRHEIQKQEGGPFKAPTVETVVLYDGEQPSEKDEGKRIIERARKRPSWFAQN